MADFARAADRILGVLGPDRSLTERVALFAAAASVGPSFEPGLQPRKTRDQAIATGAIEELVHELKKRVTILIVTHNMQQAARVSDYTAYMYLGEMIEFDKTDQIFLKPKDKRTEDYITGRMG